MCMIQGEFNHWCIRKHFHRISDILKDGKRRSQYLITNRFLLVNNSFLHNSPQTALFTVDDDGTLSINSQNFLPCIFSISKFPPETGGPIVSFHTLKLE